MRFKVSASDLLAIFAAILAHSSVDNTHTTKHNVSGIPPMTKWLMAPVNAVNAITNTLVPTAVFSSYPNTVVRTRSIIIPPPAPTNPQINPIKEPHRIDDKVLFEIAKDSVNKGLTIPGVQKKLSLYLKIDEKPRLTIVNYPIGYILKPQTEEYKMLPECEYLI